ncbi:MAG: hypothetical protein A2728_00185 [Candidatus Spechtbacteria bacterium RIFCSPHIGHO2_01_FULL_38_11]|nr:MAG: hypothetical protein A2728_00185 [Candidatus Spechtbacteria bacterium RIFCSPHIGHO2_01_FULL_38_11]
MSKIKILKHDFHIKLSDKDKEVLDSICVELGVDRSEAFRWAIKDLHWKTASRSKAKSASLNATKTQEEKCFEMGGDVIIENGRKFCRVLKGMGEVIDPLENL